MWTLSETAFKQKNNITKSCKNLVVNRVLNDIKSEKHERRSWGGFVFQSGSQMASNNCGQGAAA